MRGKGSEFVLDGFEDKDPQALKRGHDGAKQVPTETSLKSRSYSDSLPGFFKRGQGYGEFVDDSTTERLDDTSADTQFKMPYEEKCDAESGPQKQRKSADGRVPPISVKDRRNSSDTEVSGDGVLRTSPQKANSFIRSSKAQPGAQKAGSGTKTPPLPTKKTKMLSTDSECSFEALQESPGVSPGERGTLGDKPANAFSTRSPVTPRLSETGAAPIARSSPSLMSQAARLAASFGQAPRKAMARRKTDDFSPMEEQHSQENWNGSEADHKVEQKGSPQQGDVPSNASKASAKLHWYPEATSPGAVRPLLDKSAEAQISSEPALKERLRATSLQIPGTKSPAINSELHSQSARVAGEKARHSPAAAEYTGGAAETEAFDIFEPRPSPVTSDTPAAAASKKDFSVNSRESLDSVKSMKGHEALEVLQKGSLLRKKWLENNDANEAQQIQKTERLIRCRVENNKVVLHYYHQGVKGLLAKEEMSTSVQRVEIPDGSWKEGDCIILHTARGLLALAAPNAAVHSIWVLGLNAALASCSTRGKDVLLTAPVRAIPRDSMFVVVPAI